MKFEDSMPDSYDSTKTFFYNIFAIVFYCRPIGMRFSLRSISSSLSMKELKKNSHTLIVQTEMGLCKSVHWDHQIPLHFHCYVTDSWLAIDTFLISFCKMNEHNNLVDRKQNERQSYPVANVFCKLPLNKLRLGLILWPDEPDVDALNWRLDTFMFWCSADGINEFTGELRSNERFFIITVQYRLWKYFWVNECCD